MKKRNCLKEKLHEMLWNRLKWNLYLHFINQSTERLYIERKTQSIRDKITNIGNTVEDLNAEIKRENNDTQ